MYPLSGAEVKLVGITLKTISDPKKPVTNTFSGIASEGVEKAKATAKSVESLELIFRDPTDFARQNGPGIFRDIVVTNKLKALKLKIEWNPEAAPKLAGLIVQGGFKKVVLKDDPQNEEKMVAFKTALQNALPKDSKVKAIQVRPEGHI